MDLKKVIFVDADQIVRADMKELVDLDLHGAPYGYTPMGDDNTEMEGYRFWKTGYWKDFLMGLPYHISALYVVDLVRFRQMAAGVRRSSTVVLIEINEDCRICCAKRTNNCRRILILWLILTKVNCLQMTTYMQTQKPTDLPNNLQREVPIVSQPM
jgi:hypothetical protein